MPVAGTPSGGVGSAAVQLARRRSARIIAITSASKEDAVKASKAVKGDAVLERLASLWALHARQA